MEQYACQPERHVLVSPFGGQTIRRALPIPASRLHDMNRCLAERASGVDRYDLVRLAADHDLIVRLGAKAQTLNLSEFVAA
jgi:hypothetical protein